MQTLYPSIKTYAQHTLAVDGLHHLYVEESGNPEGIPVIFLHGGPGMATEAHHRSFFDPEKYRIILFDQRGCGKSTPHRELKNNNTQLLLDDIEAIRKYLDIKSWIIFGTAFGTTLGLLYAQKHSQYVRGLILHGVFLSRLQDIEWFYKNGANEVFPDYWQEFISFIPLEERHDIIAAYYKRLMGADELARMAAAKNWALWQARCSSLQLRNQIVEYYSEGRVAVALACIEAHYLHQQSFLQGYNILDNMEILGNIPGFIIHGRYDMISPLRCAWELSNTWPKSELFVVRDAGHSLLEPAVIDAVVLATQKMLQISRTAC